MTNKTKGRPRPGAPQATAQRESSEQQENSLAGPRGQSVLEPGSDLHARLREALKTTRLLAARLLLPQEHLPIRLPFTLPNPAPNVADLSNSLFSARDVLLELDTLVSEHTLPAQLRDLEVADRLVQEVFETWQIESAGSDVLGRLKVALESATNPRSEEAKGDRALEFVRDVSNVLQDFSWRSSVPRSAASPGPFEIRPKFEDHGRSNKTTLVISVENGPDGKRHTVRIRGATRARLASIVILDRPGVHREWLALTKDGNASRIWKLTRPETLERHGRQIRELLPPSWRGTGSRMGPGWSGPLIAKAPAREVLLPNRCPPSDWGRTYRRPTGGLSCSTRDPRARWPTFWDSASRS